MKHPLVVSALSALGVAVATIPAIALTFTFYDMSPQVKLAKISADPWKNTDSQHATEVEPDTFAYGSTIVSVFQEGRYNTGGGASDIGFSTSTDGGKTWKTGIFKGITRVENSKNPYDRASDPAVAYDASHKMWLAEALPILGGNGQEPVVVASKDGLTWGKPVLTAANNGDFIDKSWITCDDTKTSPYYGHCYVESDDFTLGGQEQVTTTTDGGKTWSAPYQVAGIFGEGGQPLAQPNGTVIVPYVNFSDGGIDAFRSTDGGQTWGNDVAAAPISYVAQQGNLRSGFLPTASIDGAGNIIVAWSDCSFRSGCSQDDIVYTTSADGQTWSAVQRVPIDASNSTVDHFIPGISVDPATSGSTAHISLTYYFYPMAFCGNACKLEVGYIHSLNGGSTWSKAQKLAGPLKNSWLANTDQGYMVGDYISTSHVGGLAFGVFADATANHGTVDDEFMATTGKGLPGIREAFAATSRGDRPVARRPIRPPFVPPI